MGAAAGVFIGKMIVSVVVSKVASTVAMKIGLGEDMANLVGLGAGIYAGGMVGGQAGAGAGAGSTTTGAAGRFAGDASTMNQGLQASQAAEAARAGTSLPVTVGGHTAVAPPSQLPTAPATTAPAGTPSPVPSGGFATPSPSGGMLSQAAEVTTAPGSAELVAPTTGATEPSFWEKMFTPEKTMDMLMSGVKGYSEQQWEREQLEYPEKVREADARDWERADPGRGQGFMSLNPGY